MEPSFASGGEPTVDPHRVRVDGGWNTTADLQEVILQPAGC